MAHSSPLAASSKLSLEVQEAFHDQPQSLKVLELIAAKGVLTDSQLSQLIGKKGLLIRGLANDIQRVLARKRLAVPFTVEEQDPDTVYRWKVRS
jgi:phospholipid N-methyltransferase